MDRRRVTACSLQATPETRVDGPFVGQALLEHLAADGAILEAVRAIQDGMAPRDAARTLLQASSLLEKASAADKRAMLIAVRAGATLQVMPQYTLVRHPRYGEALIKNKQKLQANPADVQKFLQRKGK